MALQDRIEQYKDGLIQHGTYNDRIYLMKLIAPPSPRYPYELIELAKANNYSKIFVKVPESAARFFAEAGFVEEARIPGFFSGEETALFMSYYLDMERKEETRLKTIQKVMTIVREKTEADTVTDLDSRFTLRQCDESDVPAMANIYQEVFPSYPFPIHDPDYLTDTMQTHVDYYGIETDGGQLVSIASSEKDMKSENVEMTDFATLPEWRGNGFAQNLLERMESDMQQLRLNTAYTIARALSPGMNITFSRAGYRFGGRLKNNTNISGNIESMNVWYKDIPDTSAG